MIKALYQSSNTSLATLLCEFAFESKLISLVETNLDSYHERKTGEAFSILLTDPILNRKVQSKSVTFL